MRMWVQRKALREGGWGFGERGSATRLVRSPLRAARSACCESGGRVREARSPRSEHWSPRREHRSPRREHGSPRCEPGSRLREAGSPRREARSQVREAGRQRCESGGRGSEVRSARYDAGGRVRESGRARYELRSPRRGHRTARCEDGSERCGTRRARFAPRRPRFVAGSRGSGGWSRRLASWSRRRVFWSRATRGGLKRRTRSRRCSPSIPRHTSARTGTRHQGSQQPTPWNSYVEPTSGITPAMTNASYVASIVPSGGTKITVPSRPRVSSTR